MAYAFFLALFPIFLLFGPRPALVGLLIAIVLQYRQRTATSR